MRSARDLAHDLGGRQAREHGLHDVGDLTRRAKGDCAALDEGRHGVGLGVVHRERVTVLEQQAGHSPAHRPETHEPDRRPLAHAAPVGSPSGLDVLVARELVERGLRDAERLHARRDTRVHRRLEKRLLNLGGRAAVAHGAAHMDGELVRAAERREHPEVHETAVTAREAGPRPNGTPAILGRQLLHGPREVRCTVERPLHVFRPQHLAPNAETLFHPTVITHGFLPLTTRVA